MRAGRLFVIAMIVAFVTSSNALAATPVDCSGGGLCTGTTGDDKMVGTSETDYLYAQAGNDVLRGRGSFDDLRGGPGDDDLDGGKGNDQYNIYDNNFGHDRISGDAGGPQDWLIFQITAAVAVDLRPEEGKPEVTSGAANTINIAKGVTIEWVQATQAADTIKGNAADNYLSGADDDDFLAGRRGNDYLLGDIVAFSNVGNDTLVGGPGHDKMDGGPGNDTFRARDGERDTIICGSGTDTVYSDRLDVVDADCENVNP